LRAYGRDWLVVMFMAWDEGYFWWVGIEDGDWILFWAKKIKERVVKIKLKKEQAEIKTQRIFENRTIDDELVLNKSRNIFKNTLTKSLLNSIFSFQSKTRIIIIIILIHLPHTLTHTSTTHKTITRHLASKPATLIKLLTLHKITCLPRRNHNIKALASAPKQHIFISRFPWQKNKNETLLLLLQ
jgi:hypothetical protein